MRLLCICVKKISRLVFPKPIKLCLLLEECHVVAAYRKDAPYRKDNNPWIHLMRSQQGSDMTTQKMVAAYHEAAAVSRVSGQGECERPPKGLSAERRVNWYSQQMLSASQDRDRDTEAHCRNDMQQTKADGKLQDLRQRVRQARSRRDVDDALEDLNSLFENHAINSDTNAITVREFRAKRDRLY